MILFKKCFVSEGNVYVSIHICMYIYIYIPQTQEAFSSTIYKRL